MAPFFPETKGSSPKQMIRFFHCESRKFLAQQSKTVADVSGGLRTPLLGPISFIFMQFRQKYCQIANLPTPGLTPLHLENQSVVASSRDSSVSGASAWSHTVSAGMIAPSFKSHQYLTGTWKRWLGCHAGCQEVDRCCTRGESQETCNMYASTMHE